MRAACALVVASWLCSCGPGAVGPHYRGEPLFTVRGQLVAQGPVPQTPLRLAIAWYPDEQTSSSPRAIVTQEVEYEGSFPLNYAFSFFSVPPDGVLSDFREGDEVTRAAFGVLLAYRDENGNGQLDSIASGASAVDHVLGTSVGDTWNGQPADAPLWVAYVDGAPGSSWAGFARGYNLWSAATREVVPGDTSVPIALEASNELDLFVCEEFISGSSYGFDLPCHVAPTGGVRVIGNVYRQNGVAGVALRITDGARPLPGLEVTLNDAGVAFDAAAGLYTAWGALPFVSPGENVVRVVHPGGAPLVFSMEAPGEFALQAPRAGARVLAGAPLTVAWTRAPRARFYQVQGYPVTPPNEGPPAVLVTEAGQASLSAQLTALSMDDTHEVAVTAFAPGYLAHGRGGSLVNVSTSRAEYVDVLPADAGAWLEGTVTFSSYQGQSGGSAWLAAFDGVTPVTNALVTANGDALPWDRQSSAYGGAVDLQPGERVTLAVTVSGRPRRTFEVALPDDFTVTAPPRAHPTRTPLRLTWTTAPNATGYRVTVTDAVGRLLHFEAVVGTTATVPGLDVTGDAFVTVAAERSSADRHLLGLVQQSFDVTLSP